MVTHDTDATQYDCAFDEWRALLAACHEYAALKGWRFVKLDLMTGLGDTRESEELRAARERAMPMALAYADRVRACLAASQEGAEPPRLLSEFHACQRLVAEAAVYNSMVATLKAVGLGGFDSGDGGEAAPSAPRPEDPDPLAYQDLSQPIEVIARRLRAHHECMEATPEMRDERQRRVMHASFVVEFGLEEGLPERRDATSEATLKEFLERLGEWEGGQQSDVVRSLVLESIPDGPAQKPLRGAARDYFEKNPGAAVLGGAIVGGIIGVLAASAAVALAGGNRGGASRGR